MSRKKKETKRDSNEYPRLIRGEPLAEIASDRLRSNLSNGEKEGIHRLTDIQKLMSETTNPKDLEYLKEEEADVKLVIYSERFLSALELDTEAKKSGLKGLFILDENGEKRNLFVEDGFLNVKADALTIMEELLDSNDAGNWIEGMRYLVYFVKFKSEAENNKRYVDLDPVALAHSKVFAMKDGYECTAQDAARALIIAECIEKNGTDQISLLREDIEDQFRLVGDENLDMIFREMEKFA